jgi:hypothetical protein
MVKRNLKGGSKKNGKRCYGNQRCIYYNGKGIRYIDQRDLITKLRKRFRLSNIESRRFIQKALRQETKRIAYDADGGFEVFNIKDEFKQMLKINFGINKVPNRKILDIPDAPTASLIKGIDIIDRKLDGDVYINTVINVFFYLEFGSTQFNYFEIVDPKIRNINGIPRVKKLLQIHAPEKVKTFMRNGKVTFDLFDGGNHLLEFDIVQLLGLKPNRNVYNLARGIDVGIYVREKRVQYRGSRKKVGDKIREYVRRLIAGRKFGDGKILFYGYEILTTYEKNIYEKSRYFLGDKEYRLEEWANIEYLGKWENGGDSCAVKFIKNNFPVLYNKIKKLETDKGIRVKDFKDFCKTNKIIYVFKTIEDKLFDTNKNDFPDVSEELINSALHAIVYSGHIYPYTGGKLKRSLNKVQLMVQVKNIEKRLESYLDSGTVPEKIEIRYGEKNKICVHSFVQNKIRYFQNPEYHRCCDIIRKINKKKLPVYINNIQTDVNIINLPQIILNSLATKYDLFSYLPEKDLYKAKALLWQTNDDFDIEKINGIDDNMSYGNALINLPYLIKHDWRKNNVRKINNKHEITETYLYYVKARYYCTMIPNTGLYPGYHLRKAKEMGVEFDLMEELETETEYNIYSDIYRELQKVTTREEFKLIYTRNIGKQERSVDSRTDLEFEAIEESDGDKYQSGFKKPIGKYTMRLKAKKVCKCVRDQLPINIQVKCFVYEKITRKCEELGWSKIKHINTDAIYYDGEYPMNIKNKDNEQLKQILGGWKKVTEKKISPGGIDTMILENDAIPTLALKNSNDNLRLLYSKYAGNGKSYEISNRIVPMCKHYYKSYIILCAQNKQLSEYRMKGFNCEIVQKYCYDNTVPHYDVYIFEEIGLCGTICHDFLCKLNYYKKSYICFGDFNQMAPTGETTTLNQEHYIKYMFNEIRDEFVNFRNDFTKEYYDSIINGKVNILEEVKKYSTPLKDAKIAVCYRNITRDKINEKVLKLKGLKPFSIGTELICRTNKLKEQNYWNYKKVTVIDRRDITVADKSKKKKRAKKYVLVLQDECGNNEYVDEKRVKRLFVHAYCLTIYGIQGDSIDSYHWASEDDHFLKKNRGEFANKFAYTLISRLKKNTPDPELCSEKLKQLEIDNKRVNIRKYIAKEFVEKENIAKEMIIRQIEAFNNPKVKRSYIEYGREWMIEQMEKIKI